MAHFEKRVDAMGGKAMVVFGNLPLAERRELEALEREWRAKPPGSAT